MDSPHRSLAVLLFWSILGAFAFAACETAPVSGDPCDPEEEEPCGFGGSCIGERCQTRCPCEPGWVCRKRRPNDLLSNEFCFLPCTADEPCPDGWGCASDEGGVCEYPPPTATSSQLEYEVFCPDRSVVGEVITCGHTVHSKSGEITGTKWTAAAPSTGGGAGEIQGADDAPQVEIRLTAPGPLHVSLSLSDEERTGLQTAEVTIAE